MLARSLLSSPGNGLKVVCMTTPFTFDRLTLVVISRGMESEAANGFLNREVAPKPVGFN